MDEINYNINESIQSNVTVKNYDLPFYHIRKTVTEDQTTGKRKVYKQIIKKTPDELVTDVIIVSATAGAINLIGNGLSHLIYSIKKKPSKKR